MRPGCDPKCLPARHRSRIAMSGIHRNRCARCARSVDTDKCTHNCKCAGCSLALCSHCEHVAEEVAVFMCDHCTSVQSGGVGDMELGKSFRSLSKCCGHYVQYCLEHDDVDNPSDSWIGWQKGCLHVSLLRPLRCLPDAFCSWIVSWTLGLTCLLHDVVAVCAERSQAWCGQNFGLTQR